MSNPLAIAATTATLRRLLESGLDGASIPVVTLPPDRAKTAPESEENGWLNLFLYNTQLNGAWRNQPLPGQVRPGENGQPPLALDLFYLITAYDHPSGETPVDAHELLGRAMSTLHDHPLLGRKEIADALAGTGLEDQIERVRITPHPLSVDELSKLWVIFQTEYRISAVYQVAVVLIDSNNSSRAALPVLKRGREDRGVAAQADLIPPFPAIESIELPPRMRNAELNTLLTVAGHHLDGNPVEARVTHLRWKDPVSLAVEPNPTAFKVQTRVPNQPAVFPAGLYRLTIRVTKPGETFHRETNELIFAVAPEITNDPVASPVQVVRNTDDVTIELDCRPSVLPAQRVSLLLGGREVPAQDRENVSTHLQFIASTRAEHDRIEAGDYFLRLRIDGVDSEIITYQGDPPVPSFNPRFRVNVP